MPLHPGCPLPAAPAARPPHCCCWWAPGARRLCHPLLRLLCDWGLVGGRSLLWAALLLLPQLPPLRHRCSSWAALRAPGRRRHERQLHRRCLHQPLLLPCSHLQGSRQFRTGCSAAAHALPEGGETHAVATHAATAGACGQAASSRPIRQAPTFLLLLAKALWLLDFDPGAAAVPLVHVEAAGGVSAGSTRMRSAHQQQRAGQQGAVMSSHLCNTSPGHALHYQPSVRPPLCTLPCLT
jgi:hypothetical protein